MNAQRELINFKKELDLQIEKYFAFLIKEAAKKDFLINQILKSVKRIILAGGKRIRPAFMYYGYIAAGGRNKKEMLRASMSVELMHFFLLIHDDIIDKDALRHGHKTINEEYKKIAQRRFPDKDATHFGNSLAIVAGDMIGALSSRVIYESNFEPSLIVKALNKLQSIIALTVIGEAKDIYIEYKKQASEKEVLKMYEYKTARYTAEGPLHLGALLGGADDCFLEKMSAYAVPLGIAFQIQDDILGIYGDEKELGKPVGSDITSGKQTLLIVKARELTNEKNRRKLDKLLGKKDLTKLEIEEFRSIIKESGAYDYAVEMARRLIKKGKDSIADVEMDTEARKFLLGIADYMISRKV